MGFTRPTQVAPRRPAHATHRLPLIFTVTILVPIDGSDRVATDLAYEPSKAGSIPVDVHPDGIRIVHSEGGVSTQFWAVRKLGLD